jgi:hypothetical protein
LFRGGRSVSVEVLCLRAWLRLAAAEKSRNAGHKPNENHAEHKRRDKHAQERAAKGDKSFKQVHDVCPGEAQSYPMTAARYF